MKNTGKRIFISIFFLLFLATASYARENFTIMVSCSIPAVPGLNTPIAENQVRVDGVAITQQNVTQPASVKQETIYVKQQDIKATDKNNKDTSPATVTSVYTR